jgi:hypothetical protein
MATAVRSERAGDALANPAPVNTNVTASGAASNKLRGSFFIGLVA